MTDEEAEVVQLLLNDKLRLVDNILTELCKEDGKQLFGFVLMMTVPTQSQQVGGMISNMYKEDALSLIHETVERFDTAVYTTKHKEGNA